MHSRPALSMTRAPRAALALLVAWAVLTLAIGAKLLAAHLVPFRAPPPGGSRDVALAGLRRADAAVTGTWTAVHVLHLACRCSGRILEHLASSERPRGFDEVVLWVGESVPALDRVSSRGFRVVRIDEDALARTFHVESVPLLVAVDPDGAVRYAGGYTERKQGAEPLDTSILLGARNDAAPAALPMFGCATSERLRASFGFLTP